MRPQGYNEVVDAVRGVVRGQDNRFVLPLVVPRVAIAAVLAHLGQLQAAQGFFLLQEVAQGRTHADVGRDGRETLYDAAHTIPLARSVRLEKNRSD